MAIALTCKGDIHWLHFTTFGLVLANIALESWCIITSLRNIFCYNFQIGIGLVCIQMMTGSVPLSLRWFRMCQGKGDWDVALIWNKKARYFTCSFFLSQPCNLNNRFIFFCLLSVFCLSSVLTVSKIIEKNTSNSYCEKQLHSHREHPNRLSVSNTKIINPMQIAE